MATPLAKQLARLTHAAPDKKQQNPSLLFSPQDAVEIDAVSLLDFACKGLADLERREPRLAEFLGTLFAPSSSVLDRALLTRDENSRLDKSLSRCLLLLSPYCATKPAHRVSLKRKVD